MDELVTTHSFSHPGTVATSPDGSYTCFAEGGAVAMAYSDPLHAQAEANYQDPIWRVRVGSVGVVPVEMAFDPDFNFTGPIDPLAPESILYIAGGRDGLWVMEASPLLQGTGQGQSPHNAYRVDDSGDVNPNTQNGRKYCNDVSFMTVDGKTYVLALFSRTDLSQLRVYKIEDVRGVAQQSTETGNELAPFIKVGLKSNPSASGRAYSFALAVDEIDANHTNVYVAMGEHGIFRVPFQDLGSGLSNSPVEHGPYFGDGSPYLAYDSALYGSVQYYEDNAPASTLLLEHSPYFLDISIENLGAGKHRLYAAVDHLGWCAFNLDVAWNDDIWTSGSSNGYPDFIQEGKRFDLQNGTPRKVIRLLHDGNLQGTKKHTHARHIEVVTTHVGNPPEPRSALIVSIHGARFIASPGYQHEGRHLPWNLTIGPIQSEDEPEEYRAKGAFVLAYDLDRVGDNSNNQQGQPYWVDDGYNWTGVSVGGTKIHGIEDSPDGELHFLYGNIVTTEKLMESSIVESIGENTIRAWYADWPDGTTQSSTFPDSTARTHDDWVERGRYYRQGRSLLAGGPSKIDPNLLVTGSNDYGTIPDGPLVFDPVQGKIKAEFGTEGSGNAPDPPIRVPVGASVPLGDSDLLTYGVLMSPRGGYVSDSQGTDFEYRLGFGPRVVDEFTDMGETTYYFGRRWRANKFRPTYASGGEIDGVILEHALHLTTPASKFSPPFSGVSHLRKAKWSGSPYYTVAATFPEYNAHVASHPSEVDDIGLLFATCIGTPQGLWAIRMTELKTLLDNQFTPPFDQEHLFEPGPSLDAAILGALTTHPEYWNVPDVRAGASGDDVEYLIQDMGHIADVQTWLPDVFQLPDPVVPGEYRWVIAVPSGYSVPSENDDPLSTNPGWEPPPEFHEGEGHEHMMVRLFDITDPGEIRAFPPVNGEDNEDSPSIPGYTILGPDPETSAFYAKGVRVHDPSGDERFLLVVGDLSGKVYLYDIEDLFTNTVPSQQVPPITDVHFGEFYDGDVQDVYETQRSLSDDFPNGVWGCEVVVEDVPDGQGGSEEVAYVYLGVPRIGVEVAKINFTPAPNYKPVLEYLGRIQTPGHVISIHVEDFGGNPPPDYPAKILYVADYNGGLRMYQNPDEAP